jgi:hypothetical protein
MRFGVVDYSSSANDLGAAGAGEFGCDPQFGPHS